MGIYSKKERFTIKVRMRKMKLINRLLVLGHHGIYGDREQAVYLLSE